MLEVFCQRDPRWAQKKLGASPLLMKDYGCTTTALAELNNRLGANCFPMDVAEHKEFYTKDGLILWPNVQMQFAIPDEKPRVYGFNQPRVLEALQHPNDRGVLLEVDFPGAQKHWLYGEAIGHNGVIYARDPYYGSIIDILKVYKKITGSAHFIRKK